MTGQATAGRVTPSPEQVAIVEHPAESVRIAAGAGTGKTTTIVMRLAAAVNAGVDPARCLGLTFTNKAADELRDRLHTTLPPRTDGREVHVATYHGFAASILDEFGGRIGHRSGSVLMDEGHRSELATRVLRSYEGDVLDLTALPQRRDDVLTLAAAMRDNLVQADAVRNAAPHSLDDTWTTRLALVDLVEAYELAKTELGLLEYGDLLRLAVAIVTEHADVAAEIRSRYDTVLLDEYQDTDPVQRLLLTTLFSPEVPVTAVGDTDQTIYEWRGASIDNFEDFPTDFPAESGRPASTLPLSINRRSDTTIIATANAVRAQLPDVGGSGGLVARPDAATGMVVAGWLRTERDEAQWIANDIAERHAAGTAFADIAVLCRKRDSMRPIADALREAGIPYAVGSMGELLAVPEIADLVAWLGILSNPADESSLLRILLGGRYRLGMADVADLTRRTSGQQTLIDVIATIDPSVLPDQAASAVMAFRSTFDELFVASQAMSVSATLDAVIDRLDFWPEVAALPDARAVTTRINLNRFIDLTERWRPLDGAPTVAGYLRYLAALDESGRADELDAAEMPADDAVRILTAHGAKGLEWDEVYLPALSTKIFPSDVLRYYDPINSAVALPYSLRLDAEAMASVDATNDIKTRRAQLKVRHDHQEWRLAYVAVTRARHRLVMTGHAWHGDNLKPKEPSALLTMVLDDPRVVRGPVVDDPGDRPEPQPFRPPATPPDPLFEEGWAAALRAAVDDNDWMEESFPELVDAVDEQRSQLELAFHDLREPEVEANPSVFATSVTNLVALAECPLKFKWIHHDRLPRRPRASARRGTEFHRKAELHNLGIVAFDDAEDASYDAVEVPEAAQEPSVDPWQVFTASRFATTTPAFVETPFELTLDGRVVRGKIDAVYVEDDAWEIVDYKSGRPSATDAKKVQLQAYALAADAGAVSTATPETVDVTFAYFGVDPVEEVTDRADDVWLEDAAETLTTLLAQGAEGPFPAAPSPSCRYCDFLHHCEAGKSFLAGSS